MSSVSAVCLLALSGDVIHRRHSLRPSPVRPSSSRLFAPPSGSGEARACYRFAGAGGWSVCLLVIVPVPLSRYCSFAFLVGLRSSASLRAGLRRRLCGRVVLYSIPDDVIRITGSCGIRLFVPFSCRRAVRSSPSACLMFAAVCLDASPPSSHRSRAWLRAVPLCVLRLVPLPASPRHRCRCLCCCRPIASRYPPSLIDTTDGEIRRGCVGSRLCLLAHRLAIPSVRFGIGWRRWFGACPVRLPPACSRPMVIIGAVLASRSRPIRFLCRPAVLPSCRPAASSSHRLSPRSIRHGGRGGGFLLPAACLCGSFSSAVDLCGFCGGWRRGLSCLLGCRIMYLVDGVMW